MENIGKLALALSKAQGEMKGAVKDAANPFYKANYADLASVWDACRKALSSNELAVIQSSIVKDSGEIMVRTVLAHSSGEFIEGFLPVMVGDKATAQQMGSAITYARRYALAAMVGVAPEDDDGNAASGSPKVAKEPSLNHRVKSFEEALKKSTSEEQLNKVVSNGNNLLAELHKSLPEAHDELQIKISQYQESFRLQNA